MDVPKVVKWRLNADAACGSGTVAPFAGFARVLERERLQPADARRTVVGLFDELRASLYRYLRWLGSTPAETDDAIQETFLRLHTHLCTGGSQENLRSWVFRVAGNLVRDERRSSRSRRSEPLDSQAQVTATLVDPIANPEQIALARESHRRLGIAIRKLPLDQQKCLALRGQGLRYREIGGILGIGTTTVSDLLQRAVRTLASELARELP
jgi:RNA polymerase sigma-70 factor, ECF subfamily